MKGYMDRRTFLKKVGLGITSCLLLSGKNVEAKVADAPSEALLEKMNKAACYSSACYTDSRDFPDLCREDKGLGAPSEGPLRAAMPDHFLYRSKKQV